MARPIANPAQRLRAFQLYHDGYGPAATLNKLREEFERPVSTRTVATWVKEFKVQVEETGLNLDAPFEWHRLEEYGLPWEASDYLLEILWLHQNGKIVRSPSAPAPTPSVRQVRWWWRIHKAVPTIGKRDTWFLALRFMLRELAHDVLNLPLDVADLEAHLAYKPWDEDRREIYNKAVEDGRIPGLKDFHDVINEARQIRDISDSQGILWWAVASVGVDTDHPELLLTQQLKRRAESLSEGREEPVTHIYQLFTEDTEEVDPL